MTSMADWRPTWQPGTLGFSWPCSWLSLIVPTAARAAVGKNDAEDRPVGQVTLLTYTSSVNGFVGSLD
jgi:hypothetical protein